MRGVRSALKSSQDHLAACVHSQRTPTRELLNYTKANGQELVGLAVELAEEPSGGVQVRVLMDSNVVSGVTVAPLQQGGCCDGSAEGRMAWPPARLPHGLSILNGVVPQHLLQLCPR